MSGFGREYPHSSTKHLAIQVLEFVRSKPAHKLPVLFTLGECPLPECSESPEEVFQEVLRLEREGLIEAHVNRDVKSNPKEIEVRYVTLAGAIHLESQGPKTRETSPSRASLAGAKRSL
jgi:hypothetical protein